MASLHEDDEWLLGASLEHQLAQSLPEQQTWIEDVQQAREDNSHQMMDGNEGDAML
jgi:hypothetical protein